MVPLNPDACVILKDASSLRDDYYMQVWGVRHSYSITHSSVFVQSFDALIKHICKYERTLPPSSLINSSKACSKVARFPDLAMKTSGQRPYKTFLHLQTTTFPEGRRTGRGRIHTPLTFCEGYSSFL